MTVFASPWFLDKPAPEATLLAGEGAKVISVAPGHGDKMESLAPQHQALADAVAKGVAGGQVPVCAVGDCCQSIAVMAGLARNGIVPTVIWFDAHGDFNTWETSPSGFIGGMPLAMLTGRGDQRMMQAVGLAPIEDDKVILTDARDLDPGERVLVKASRIRHVEDAADLPDVSLPKGSIYVHFDMDILDSRDAPAFMYPVPGGPTVEDMHTVLAYLKSTGQVVAWSATASWDSGRPGARETLAATRQVWDAITT